MTSVALCMADLNVGGAERCLVELATRLGRESRRHTEHEFTIEGMVAFYQDLWERIVAGPR